MCTSCGRPRGIETVFYLPDDLEAATLTPEEIAKIIATQSEEESAEEPMAIAEPEEEEVAEEPMAIEEPEEEAPAPASDTNAMMSQDDIAALLASMNN